MSAAQVHEVMTDAEFRAEVGGGVVRRQFGGHGRTKEFRENAALKAAADVVKGWPKARAAILAKCDEIGIGSAGKAEAVGKAAQALSRQWMMTRLPTIDLSFASAPWWVHVEREGRDNLAVRTAYRVDPALDLDPAAAMVAKIERFFNVAVDARQFITAKHADIMGDDQDRNRVATQRAAGNIASRGRGKLYEPPLRPEFTAAVPEGITPAHVARVRQAVAHNKTLHAVLLAHGLDLRADINLLPEVQGKTRTVYGREDCFGMVDVLWAPRLTALAVRGVAPRPKGDPAIIYTVDGTSYLAAFYDTPAELPLEGILREFTGGTAGVNEN